VRFWDSENGTLATFEDAQARGGAIGVSQAIVILLNPSGIPTPMAGLQSAGLVAPIITLTRSAPATITTSTTVANGTQMKSLCGVPVGTNRWFRITSPSPGDAIITTVGSAVDTVMSAYTGSIISPGALTLVTCNDNRASGGTASEVTFSVEADKLYLLCVAGKNGATGNIRLNHMLATSLFIRRNEPRQIELSWPADATNCFPEKSTRFFDAGSWTAITNPPLTVTNRRILHLECGASGELYRLRLRD
jgi:hypothetical protein